MTITRSITISVPDRPSGYDPAVRRVGKFHADNDCDIIGCPKLPASLRQAHRMVAGTDERLRREERTYHFVGDLIRSPEEGNCYWIRGFGYILRGDQSTDPDDWDSAPVDMEIATQLYATAEEAAAELDRCLSRAVAAIRLDTAAYSQVRADWRRPHHNAGRLRGR